METVTIIHNPKCSKSRGTLELIQSKGFQPTVIDYLGGELSRDLLLKALSSLKMRPKEVLRIKDVETLNLSLDQENDTKVIEAILKHPMILERPIVMRGDKAIIGRPPENVLSILN